MLPDRNRLERGLREVMRCRAVDVVNRQPNHYSSTFPSETIECVLDTGETRRLMCKYSGGIECRFQSHSRGVEHEADVYRCVIQPTGAKTVVFYGAYRDPDSGWIWLVMEYLARALRLDRMPESLETAAHWIGTFHAASAPSAVDHRKVALRQWDDGYYRNWAMRTKELACLAPETLNVADLLSQRKVETCIRRLVEADRCVVHGEYYPHNILVCEGSVFPIDWESASIGAGEIDLAAMTERWPEAAVRISKQAYCQSRWPQGEPPNFEQTFFGAQAYWHFRWIGGRPSRAGSPRLEWRWRELASCLAQISEL